MPGKYNYELRHKYPHLIGEDTAVWQRFIQKYPDRFTTVDYDVKVGKGIETGPKEDPKYTNYWQNLTKKRIDVIGYTEISSTLIECKKRITLPTLGQILGYKVLYLRDHPDLDNIKTLIIAAAISHDDSYVLEHFSIDYIII